MQPRLKSLSIDAGQLRTWTAPLRSGGPDVYYIRIPVSSANVDRDGDRFSEAGLDRLASQLDKGTIPVFPNHGLDPNGWSSYRFEDAYGVWVKGEIEDGVLYGTAALDPDDYRTQVIARKIERGFPVSTSIGFFPLTSTPDGDGELFDDAELVEISFVGIPSNREATAAVRAVVKSLLNAAGITVPDDTDIPAKMPGSSESDPVMTDKELKEKPDEGEEEEQEEEEKTKPCDGDDERKQPEEEPEEEEEEEEEKAIGILDEAAVRAIVADEMGKALAPALKALGEVKAIVEKTATVPKGKGPRAIVIARDVEPEQTKSTEPAGKPDIIIP